MAETSSAVASPVTEEGLIAERQAFWGSFTTATTGVVIFIVVLLILMAIFLV